MSLFYPPDERAHRGKTSEKEDMVDVRFVELAPARRIVEAVSFVTTDPALSGEMTMTATFETVSGGTEVTLLFTNLPPGLRAEDNEPVRGCRWNSWRAGSNDNPLRYRRCRPVLAVHVRSTQHAACRPRPPAIGFSPQKLLQKPDMRS